MNTRRDELRKRINKALLGLGVVGIASSPINAGAQNPASSSYPSHRQTNERSNNRAPERKYSMDINKEIESCADRFCQQVVNNAFHHYNEITKCARTSRSAKSSALKNYVKRNIFDVVAPRSGLTGADAYCIATLSLCIMEANKTLEYLPQKMIPGSTECNNFMRKVLDYTESVSITIGRNGRPCINTDLLENGDIVFTPRAPEKYHAQMAYIENGKVRLISFNKEHIDMPQPIFKEGYYTKAKIFKQHEFMKDMIRQYMLDNQLIPQDYNRNGETVLPIENARQITNYINGNSKAQKMLTINMSHTSDLTNTTLYSFNDAQQKAGAKKTGSEKTIDPRTNYTFFSKRNQSRG